MSENPCYKFNKTTELLETASLGFSSHHGNAQRNSLVLTPNASIAATADVLTRLQNVASVIRLVLLEVLVPSRIVPLLPLILPAFYFSPVSSSLEKYPAS